MGVPFIIIIIIVVVIIVVVIIIIAAITIITIVIINSNIITISRSKCHAAPPFLLNAPLAKAGTGRSY